MVVPPGSDLVVATKRTSLPVTQKEFLRFGASVWCRLDLFKSRFFRSRRQLLSVADIAVAHRGRGRRGIIGSRKSILDGCART